MFCSGLLRGIARFSAWRATPQKHFLEGEALRNEAPPTPSRAFENLADDQRDRAEDGARYQSEAAGAASEPQVGLAAGGSPAEHVITVRMGRTIRAVRRAPPYSGSQHARRL